LPNAHDGAGDAHRLALRLQIDAIGRIRRLAKITYTIYSPRIGVIV
jgi:hypothetical protein